MRTIAFKMAALAKESRRIFPLAFLLMIVTVLSGCTINRVSILAPAPSAHPVKPGDVRLYSSFKDMAQPWKIEGMISAKLLPIMRNSPDNREELIRNTVAARGINAVVGVQATLNGNMLLGISNAILANTGVSNEERVNNLPKFIVVLPAINYRIEKDPSMDKFDEILREHLQHFMGYSKGYYVYHHPIGPCNSEILQDRISPETLGEPLGIVPHYALLCDIDGYDESGNVIFYRARSIKITLTLFDLKEKKIAWTSNVSGNSKQSILLQGLAFIKTRNEETCVMIRRALTDAMDSLPKVAGFQMGPPTW